MDGRSRAAVPTAAGRSSLLEVDLRYLLGFGRHLEERIFLEAEHLRGQVARETAAARCCTPARARCSACARPTRRFSVPASSSIRRLNCSFDFSADSSRPPPAAGRGRRSAGSPRRSILRATWPRAAASGRRRCPCRRSLRAAAKPLTVSTRFGIRSLRRWSWFSTCAHCALTASSCLTNVLYEQPVSGSAHDATSAACSRVLRVIFISAFYQLAPPPPPPLRPPPKPPNPPPKPPPPPPKPPPPKPPPNGPTPLDHPPPPPQNLPPSSAAAAADAADDEERDEEPEERRHADRRAAAARASSVRGARTPSSVTPRPCAMRPMMRSVPASSPAPYRPALNCGRHDLAAGFAGEAVGDPLLEVVADLDFDAPLLDREQDEQAVVLALLADAAPVILEQLDRVVLDGGVRLDGRHRRDDDDVAGCLLQRADHPVHLRRARGIDHVREIVDRLGQLGQRRRLSER